MDKPYTLNVIYRDGNICTHTYTVSRDAIIMAQEEVKWENTVHAEVVHEPSGDILFAADGDYPYSN